MQYNRLLEVLLVKTQSDLFFFFFNDTATTEIYTLSLHDALPIYRNPPLPHGIGLAQVRAGEQAGAQQRRPDARFAGRSEEHTSELQSPCNIVCRLLLEKKKKKPPVTTRRV